METTEKIVESYCRYVKGWFTLPNIKCRGQLEIDLMAVDLAQSPPEKYHIETSVSISSAFAKLTAKEYDPERAKQRVQQPSQRRTIGFFRDKKFGSPEILETLESYGFEPGEYRKVIVSMGWKDDAEIAAQDAGIELWDFRDLLRQIAEDASKKRTYFTDDTLRTIQLFVKSGT